MTDNNSAANNKAARKAYGANSGWKEVSPDNPCPLCEKPDWCGISTDGKAVLCRRIDIAPPGWKHIKDSKDGYPVYAAEDGNDWKNKPAKKKPTPAKPRNKSIPLSPGKYTLVELSSIAVPPEPTKTRHPKHGDVLQTRYVYNDTHCIVRTQWRDDSKPKGYAKEFKPCRRIGSVETGDLSFAYDKGGYAWGAYKIDEVLAAIAETEDIPVILFQEGEGCVEIARELGLASTTVTGADWTTEGLTEAIQPIARTGAVIAFLADNDKPGAKKSALVREVCATLKTPCVFIPATAIWADCPEGGDIKEILEHLNGEQFTTALINQVYAAVEYPQEQEEIQEDNDAEDEPASKSSKELPKHSVMAAILKPSMGTLRYRDDYHQWMRYEDGYWAVATEESIFQTVTFAIENIFPSHGFSASYPTGVAKMMVSHLLYKNWPEQPRNLLPFRNGVLDLDTNKLLKHSPNYGFENIIDRDHDLNATDWSAIDEWMEFVFEGNQGQKRLLLCWYAAVLRGLSELHRFALLVGEGGTGKSTAMKLATNLIGKRASHSLTLEALNTNSFQCGNIYDKRLVCINDADRYHGHLGVFKNITGGDEVSVEWKFQKAFNAVYRGLVMATANNPVFTSNDSGLDRRQIIFRFDRRVTEIDTQFAAKLAAQTSAFTNYLLTIPENEIISTLLYKLDNSGQRVQNELDALLQTNAVAQWLNLNYAYDPESRVRIGDDKSNTDQLYGDYCDYCAKSNSSPRSSREFSPELIRLGKGYLLKDKTKQGFVCKGLIKSSVGGVIESIINIANSKNTSDYAHPAHYAPAGWNQEGDTVPPMQGKQPNHAPTMHPPQNAVHSGAGLVSDHAPTMHPPQTDVVQDSQPINISKVQGVHSESEITRLTRLYPLRWWVGNGKTFAQVVGYLDGVTLNLDGGEHSRVFGSYHYQEWKLLTEHEMLTLGLRWHQ